MESERISRDDMLMEIADTYAKRSTCSRAHVGAIVARQGRVLVGAYNGAPSGMPHCDHTCDCEPEVVEPHEPSHDPDCRSEKPCVVAVHAEANAIAWAARMGNRLEGAELFTTMAPCRVCATLVINAGIRRVVCKQAYRDPSGVQLLQVAGIRVSG